MAFRACSRPEALAGEDLNSDGVRDDVEKFIEMNYSNSRRIRSVARELAKTLQEQITQADTWEDQRQSAAISCLFFVTPENAYAISQTLQSVTANTYLRARALLRASAKFSGKILTMPSTRKEACAFDPGLAE